MNLELCEACSYTRGTGTSQPMRGEFVMVRNRMTRSAVLELPSGANYFAELVVICSFWNEVECGGAVVVVVVGVGAHN